jgi:hypothetical protein
LAAGIICDVFGAPGTIPLPSGSAGGAARRGAAGRGNRALRRLGSEIPGGGHTRARPQADHRHRPDGSYRFSRNPIYLAFSLIHLGIASWANSVWLLATLVGAVALIHYVVIRREERYLERRFSAEYLPTKPPCAAGCRRTRGSS